MWASNVSQASNMLLKDQDARNVTEQVELSGPWQIGHTTKDCAWCLAVAMVHTDSPHPAHEQALKLTCSKSQQGVEGLLEAPVSVAPRSTQGEEVGEVKAIRGHSPTQLLNGLGQALAQAGIDTCAEHNPDWPGRVHSHVSLHAKAEVMQAWRSTSHQACSLKRRVAGVSVPMVVVMKCRQVPVQLQSLTNRLELTRQATPPVNWCNFFPRQKAFGNCLLLKGQRHTCQPGGACESSAALAQETACPQAHPQSYCKTLEQHRCEELCDEQQPSTCKDGGCTCVRALRLTADALAVALYG